LPGFGLRHAKFRRRSELFGRRQRGRIAQKIVKNAKGNAQGIPLGERSDIEDFNLQGVLANEED
jgi:hypothetical protein